MVRLFNVEGCARERDLEGKRVQQPKLFPAHNSRGRLLGLLHLECAVVKREGHALHGEQAWEEPLVKLLIRVLVVVTSVNKGVLLTRVPVEVTKKCQFGGPLEFAHQGLKCVDGGGDVLMWCIPKPVEVAACERAAIIPVYHTIGIEHWHHHKDELIAQRRCSLIISRQGEQKPVHDVRCVRLAWVNSCGKHYCALLARRAGPIEGGG
eukprot:scaffold124572_cov27-Tisochrysis_lutea.AAC.4